MIENIIGRADALLTHAKYLGAPLKEFAVLVSLAEGFELLTWILEQRDDQTIDQVLLQSDAAVAIATGDPWYVLEHFTLKGLPIFRALPEPADELAPPPRLDS